MGGDGVINVFPNKYSLLLVVFVLLAAAAAEQPQGAAGQLPQTADQDVHQDTTNKYTA